jgi:hypothetical protein
MFSNPIVKTVLTVIAVVLVMKYVAPKIPVVGSYISIT